MADKENSSGAKRVVVIILTLLAAANAGYFFYRELVLGKDDSMPLVIAALVCSTMALAISRMGAKR